MSRAGSQRRFLALYFICFITGTYTCTVDCSFALSHYHDFMLIIISLPILDARLPMWIDSQIVLKCLCFVKVFHFGKVLRKRITVNVLCLAVKSF